jgi:phosphoglycolate phosphatase-like HAD superfamily hydrolase
VPLDLIIFDCDGVLVDSEVISCRAHSELLTRHGYAITAEQVLERFLGVSDREAFPASPARALPGWPCSAFTAAATAGQVMPRCYLPRARR